VIDTFGPPLATLSEGALGVIDRPLPPALADTPFRTLGDIPFWLFIALSAGCAALARRKA
jgi:apolipoprotein N-acyltransferase